MKNYKISGHPEYGPKPNENLFSRAKRALLFTSLLLTTTCWQSMNAGAQTVKTFAGTGVSGYSGDGGIATSAQFSSPYGIVFDAANNMYFADPANNRVRMVNPITGIIKTVVGNTGVAGYNGSGTTPISAASGKLNNPSDLAIDASGNLYIADAGNKLIRKVTNPSNTSTSTMVDFAGTPGVGGYPIDGTSALSADIYVSVIGIDPLNNIYYSDGGPSIRVIYASSGNIYRFAGTGTIGDYTSGVGVLATSVNFTNSKCIKSDALGNIFFSDLAGTLIHKVDLAGNITKVAGIFNSPGWIGDGSPATSHTINGPMGICFDGIGNMYIGDYMNDLVRKIAGAGLTPGGGGGTISSAVGIRTNSSMAPLCTAPASSPIGNPTSVAVDNFGNLYIADATHPRILIVSSGTQLTNVDINTLCAATFTSNGAIPTFTVIPSGGVPPYSFTWTANPGNTTTLNSYSSPTPQISGTGVADYTLSVSDNAASCISTDSRHVKATLTTSATPDLAMRDSYFDMYDEPNSQAVVTGHGEVDLSPDLWNRLFPDGINQHLPPCSGGCTNYMYVTVRNIGCQPSTPSSLYMYWTAAGVETWPGDWNGSVPFGPNPSAGPQGNVLPGMPLSVASLPPGASQKYYASWTPPNPQSYIGQPEMEMCFLARVPDPGFAFGELSGIGSNVRNNNNIVTRNTAVIRVTDYAPRRSYFLVGNSEIIGRTYSIQFKNDNIQQSTLNQFVNVTVSLGSTLFNSWVQGGAQGTYAAINYQNQTVTFDGTNTMELDNININAGQEYQVALDFAMLNNASGAQMQDETVHFRELYFNSETNTTEIYANYNYLVTYGGPGGVQGGGGGNNGPGSRLAKGENSSATSIENNIKVYPNPATTTLNFEFPLSGNVDIKLMDITGRIVENQSLQNASKTSMDVKGLVPGMYLYQITNDNKVQKGKINIGE